MVGLATAWHLQEHGVEVTVLDRSGVAAGSSWGNAGWISPGLCVPLSDPSVLNYGLTDLAGKALTHRQILERAREIRKAIRLFEPRFERDSIAVDPSIDPAAPNTLIFSIQGEITSAVQAMPSAASRSASPSVTASMT